MNLVVIFLSFFRIFYRKYDCISLFHVKIVFLTHVFKKKIDRHYSLVKVNKKRVYEKNAFFITYNMQKTNFKNSSQFSRKLQKTVFRVLSIFPQIHRSV